MNVRGDQEYGWVDERWFCGNEPERCRYCGGFVIFAPRGTEIEVCRCNAKPDETYVYAALSSRKLNVRFARPRRFAVRAVSSTIGATRSYRVTPLHFETERRASA